MAEELETVTSQADTQDELNVSERDIVVPGDILAKGMGYLPGPGTYRDGQDIRASRLGLVNISGKILRLVPLSGAYSPKEGDRIIAKVIDLLLSGWRCDIRSPYTAMLSVMDGTSDYVQKGADLTQYYNIGDYAMVKITRVTTQKLVDLSARGPGLKKLDGGRIIEVNCKKVPRIIGKDGSMVSMIKQATGCGILVGQNGLVWIQGEPDKELIATETIREIEAKAHLSGLTDLIKKKLEERTGVKVEPRPEPQEASFESGPRGGPRNGPRRGPGTRGPSRGPGTRGPGRGPGARPRPRRGPPRGPPRGRNNRRNNDGQ